MGRSGAQGRRVRPDPRDPRPAPDQLGAGDVLGHVERALLLQVLQGAPQAVRRDSAGDARRQDAGRHRRERRRHRHRPGLRGHVQDRVAQPPVVRRALPGCRDRGRRHRPRHPRDGRAARSPSWTRSGSARSTPRTPTGYCPGSSPESAATATASGLPNIGGEAVFDPTYLGNPLVNALCVGVLRHEDLHLAKASGNGNKVILYGARTGGDGIGGVSVLASETFDADGPAKRPERPGRRPVHGEAAHRVHARAVPGRRGRRHPGPRRRRPLLRHLRARVRRRRRHVPSSSTGSRCATPRSRPRRS